MTDVLLDSNLAILLVVGTTERDLIMKHKRLTAYTVEDFDCLVELMADYAAIVVTPNTLTETNNLCRYLPESARSRVSDVFAALVDSSKEEYVASTEAIQDEEFPRLGLTDAVLLKLTTKTLRLLTADHDLYAAAMQRGYDAMNFNHFRPIR